MAGGVLTSEHWEGPPVRLVLAVLCLGDEVIRLRAGPPRAKTVWSMAGPSNICRNVFHGTSWEPSWGDGMGASCKATQQNVLVIVACTGGAQPFLKDPAKPAEGSGQLPSCPGLPGNVNHPPPNPTPPECVQPRGRAYSWAFCFPGFFRKIHLVM